MPGQRWRNRYLVVGGEGDGAGRWFKAVDTDDGAEVLLRVTRATGPSGRAAVWQRIKEAGAPQVQRPREVHEAGERVEVWEAPRGETLRHWRASGSAPGPEWLQAVIRQLTAAVESLHFAGLGHFGLSVDSVYVREEGSGPVITLAGWDHAALNEGNELIAIPVDPFTAPPESAGLFQHAPGESLCAWDWWSIGRLLQELLLGHPVAVDLPEGQLARTLPAAAAALLSEHEYPGVRAGAVELMPGLDESLSRLLRGLLTTAVSGRWGAIEVKEWLAGRRPAERYTAARLEKFFRYQGRGYTVPEFARTLLEAPVADEAVRHLFVAEAKDTLAHFLAENTGQADGEKRIAAARELTGAVALRPFAESLRREIAAVVAWHGLAGGAFRWRGQPLGDSRLREQLLVAGTFRELRATLQALATPLVLNYINGQDPETVRLLERLVRTACEAEEHAVKSRWIKLDAPAAQAALWQAALQPDVVLLAAEKKIHEAYAASDDGAFQALFTAPKPTRVTQVLLAWAAGDPPAVRLVTHEELRRRRQKELLTEGAILARTIFWLRLDRAMRAGPWLFGGRWFLIVAGLVLLSLLAVHVPGPWGVALGLVPLVILAGARLALNRWQAALVKAWSPASAPWDWRAGPGRSARELSTMTGKPGMPPTLAGAKSALKRVTAELSQLAEANQPAQSLPRAPRHAATWAVVAFGWLVVLGLAAGSISRGLVHPPTWSAHVTAWQKTMEKERRAKPVSPPDQRISWPYKVPADAAEITLRGAFTPTDEQAAAAIRRGKAQVSPFKPETISSLVAIYVPLGAGQGGRHGLVLFDGKKGTLLGRAGVIIDFMPFARTGMQIGDQQAFFIEH